MHALLEQLIIDFRERPLPVKLGRTRWWLMRDKQCMTAAFGDIRPRALSRCAQQS